LNPHSSASATVTTATFFFTVVPFLLGYLVVPDPYQLAGLGRGTTASLQQCSGQARPLGGQEDCFLEAQVLNGDFRIG